MSQTATVRLAAILATMPQTEPAEAYYEGDPGLWYCRKCALLRCEEIDKEDAASGKEIKRPDYTYCLSGKRHRDRAYLLAHEIEHDPDCDGPVWCDTCGVLLEHSIDDYHAEIELEETYLPWARGEDGACGKRVPLRLERLHGDAESTYLIAQVIGCGVDGLGEQVEELARLILGEVQS